MFTYRNKAYFEEHQNGHFVFWLLEPELMRVAKVVYEDSYWWVVHDRIWIKAYTVQCIALKELHRVNIAHKNHANYTGSINGNYGLTPTFIGVLWDQPGLYFWNDINLICKIETNFSNFT